MLDAETVDRMATLARLELTVAEREALARELGLILEYVDRLRVVDTSADPPEAMVQRAGPEALLLREDRVGQSLPPSAILGMAPETEGDQVRVPPFLAE